MAHRRTHLPLLLLRRILPRDRKRDEFEHQHHLTASEVEQAELRMKYEV